MASPRKPRDPFEVTLTEEQRTDLARRLAFEITEAVNARESIIGDGQRLDQLHQLYEGGDPNLTKNTPWPGASNLTSWIGTEKVDAFRARVVKTIYSEPVWIVTMWGAPPERVALVEKFHQWKVEEERLQGYLTRVVHNALIEGTGVLEVSERPVMRKQRQRMRVLVQTNEQGVPVGDPQTGQPVPLLQQGAPVPAPPGTPPEQTTMIVMDRLVRTRSGPQYSVIDLRDFVILPGHAKERKDVWGYAKRFYKRLPDLQGLQALGVYQNVGDLGTEDERVPTQEMLREGQGLADQSGPTAEKELWEMTFLDDLDGDGIQEWYVATLHVEKRVLLRLQRDDLGQARYLLFIPFPRTRFIYGYSLIGHKLATIIDEHSAWRNIAADRAKLVNAAPIKRLIGSLWNPSAVPWGPNQVLPVRDMNEVQPMTIPDVPMSVVRMAGEVLAASERVAGMVDTAAGTHPTEDRTLGEVKTVLGESLIRVEEVVRHLQEAMEDLFQIRHEIYKRTLQETQGMPLPYDLMASMEARGMTPPPMITAADLEGPVRGKPRGSVETADLGVMRSDYVQFLTALTQFSQAVPAFAVLFQDPDLGRQLLAQAIRVFRWEGKEAMEQALDRATQKAQAMIQQQQAMGMDPTPAGGAGKTPGQGAMTRKMGVQVRQMPQKRGRPAGQRPTQGGTVAGDEPTT